MKTVNMDKSIIDDEAAFELALQLAITAPTEAKADECVSIAEMIAIRIGGEAVQRIQAKFN